MKHVIVDRLPSETRPTRLDGRQYHHLVHVRRSQPGDTLRIADGRGATTMARIDRIEAGYLLLVPAEGGGATPAVACHGTAERRPGAAAGFPSEDGCVVFVAMLKGGRTDQVIRQLTEVGATRIGVVETARSVARLASAGVARRLARWRSIAREASEQSGRTRVPDVDYHDRLAPLLSADEPATSIVFHEQAPTRAFPQMSATHPCRILVGPEGGFSAEEIDLFQRRGWIAVGLPFPVMRAETAAVAATALVQYVRSFYTPV